MKQRRRTFRAHGRMGAYMCSPCHIEVILKAFERPVRKGVPEQHLSKRKRASLRWSTRLKGKNALVTVGGGAAAAAGGDGESDDEMPQLE